MKELSELLNLSTRAVEKQISKLKLAGKLERKGFRRQDYLNIL
ncbi:hypothetical protein [uncultured Desulfobacter sp.]